ncbi:MAG: hypothetical protein D3906_12760, partial [Candidatus Electrothrix sp. AUS1_2]|nr:hypothetical protein [Candidatus Electrothrix sp. AUS1_2]
MSGLGRDTARRVSTVVVLIFFIILAQVNCAAGADIRKFCAPEIPSSQTLQIFLPSNINSQQAALERNTTLQEGKILYSAKEGNALFHISRIGQGDCVLVNLQEAMPLAAEDAAPASGPGVREKVEKTHFFPAVLFVHRSKSKQYGLIAEKVLRRLQPVRKKKETATELIANAETDPDLFLIYVLCPADRSTPCDLTIKRNGKWLLDGNSGKQFRLSVLARSIRSSSPGKAVSRRIRINHDTPQGIYTIWGAVTGGGDSSWFQTARIDLDAAMPPINAQPYPINSFLFSRIVPESALDDYWINEWPLAYSLGRIALRIAPGDFEARQPPNQSSASGDS